MNAQVLVAALFVGVAVAVATGLVVRPTRQLGPRIELYAQVSRSRLGRAADLSLLTGLGSSVSGTTVGRVFSPLVRAAALWLSRLLDVGGEAQLALRLRQGGFNDVSVEEYRIRQLGWAVAGTLGGGFGGAVLLGGAAPALGLGALGFIVGATQWRGRVNKAIKTRRARMRLELYTVAQLLAMFIRTGHGPVEAMRGTVRRGSGPVVEELGEAMAWIAGGMGEAEALERLAEDTAEPAAARLYRLLAAGIEAGGDLGAALLTASDDLRSERREDVERQATARRGAMLIPTIAVMAPVVLLFLIAPLPSLIFGHH